MYFEKDRSYEKREENVLPPLIPMDEKTFITNSVPLAYPTGTGPRQHWTARGGIWSQMGDDIVYWGPPYSANPDPGLNDREVKSLQFEGYVGFYKYIPGYVLAGELSPEQIASIPVRTADLGGEDFDLNPDMLVGAGVDPATVAQLASALAEEKPAAPVGVMPPAAPPAAPAATKPASAPKPRPTAANKPAEDKPASAPKRSTPRKTAETPPTAAPVATVETPIREGETVVEGDALPTLIVPASTPQTATEPRRSLGGGGSRMARLASSEAGSGPGREPNDEDDEASEDSEAE